ncbi:arylsulfatase A-like enzyme [Actinoplanes lutulentus]|uniref:Arylsulfatase A-like enzyme n=1 Tax=Actinoplanes lutulentus TaxID=1287878 RepID=A0A327Z7H1_9ACTN|nr:sulfatase [Actinoplanes lutulentus]MBB2948545.1 arylsulfatase A-like enzyme [Actinoplanes lutulentus]RAK34423.1 arylsulfatase A-like enzyme [Actinoplanes lutulentus]
MTPLLPVLALLASALAPPAPAAVADRPNIVFVLVDDLSKNLIPYMPNVQRLERDGTTFTNYTVTDSLCCPSRASILTGRYPHNTGIVKNHGSDGGFLLFRSRGEEKSTFATDLQSAGYRTAFLGKYLNEYLPESGYVPPGWDLWVAGGNAYDNFEYMLNENGSLVRYGSRPQDYLTDVLSVKARSFIRSSAQAGKPFAVEISTYTPHLPYPAAPRDAESFPGLTAPRGSAYGKVPKNAPGWLAPHSALTGAQIAHMDRGFRQRVQSVQAIDRMLGDLRVTLDKAGVADDTVVVFSSDNGYHMGEYRLNPGKQTAFDVDVNVPLVVAGAGVKVGQVSDALVENVDLRPTFGDLAGARVPGMVDGRSVRALLGGLVPQQWRTGSLIEHSDPATDPADPDYQKQSENTPPSYDALRTAEFTWVEYVDGTREYYDRRSDPAQMLNLAGGLDPERVTELSERLRALATCAGSSCRSAGG